MAKVSNNDSDKHYLSRDIVVKALAVEKSHDDAKGCMQAC